MLKDFKQFIIRGNVVDLAIAVVVGGAFNGVVQAMVRDLITPLIAAFGGQSDFSKLHFSLRHSVFNYGDFLNLLVSFVLTAVVVFFFVVQPVNRLMRLVKGDTPTEPTTRPCPECKSNIPIDATRCRYCTTKVQPVKTPRPPAA